ncbi:MAG: Lrp/AsnC ligand binding domain-containing protein [Nitrospirae bacterium]|nr:Lrp/AsnC ligand binding domain-containing protein [Nitrospirota bacterium]
MSLSAYVLIRVVGDKTESAFKFISALKGVKSVHTVTGPYDIIALVEAPDLKGLGEMILSKIRTLDGVRETTTCIVVTV